MEMTFEELMKQVADRVLDEDVKAFLALEESDDVEIVKDVTGTPLTPGHPKMCLGNGGFPGFEICCDECDYYLKCFSAEVDAMFEA